jgi:hypothetical protein
VPVLHSAVWRSRRRLALCFVPRLIARRLCLVPQWGARRPSRRARVSCCGLAFDGGVSRLASRRGRALEGDGFGQFADVDRRREDVVLRAGLRATAGRLGAASRAVLRGERRGALLYAAAGHLGAAPRAGGRVRRRASRYGLALGGRVSRCPTGERRGALLHAAAGHLGAAPRAAGRVSDAALRATAGRSEVVSRAVFWVGRLTALRFTLGLGAQEPRLVLRLEIQWLCLVLRPSAGGPCLVLCFGAGARRCRASRRE